MKKSIKGDRTLLLTSILLFFMLAAGIMSGVLGFVSGHEALKGVTQPDIRPNNNKGNKEAGILTTDGVHLNDAGNEFVADEMMKALVK